MSGHREKAAVASAGLRLLHYWWPIVMGASLVAVVQRATGHAIDPAGLTVFLSGIVTAYSLDRLLDPHEGAESRWLRSLLALACVAAVVAGTIGLARLPVRAALLVPVLGAIVLGYPWIKTLPMLKTMIVPMAWTWSAIALPFHDGSWLGWGAWHQPVAVPLTLIVAGGCLLCDLKDTDADRAAAVASLPVLVGVRRTVAIAAGLAVVGTAAALMQHRFGLMIGGIAMTVAGAYPDRLAHDAEGPLVVDMILTIPGLLVALHVV